MWYPNPTESLPATDTLSANSDAQTVPAIEQVYNIQTPQAKVYPHTDVSSTSNPDCDDQQYPGASSIGNEAWLNNDQASLADMGVPPDVANQYQTTQDAFQQWYQPQMVSTVPVKPPFCPAAYPSPSGGTANVESQAQGQTMGWNFTNDVNQEIHDDFSLLAEIDLNTHATSNFHDFWTMEAAQMPEEQKYHTGYSRDCPVDLTSSSPLTYTALEVPSSSFTEQLKSLQQMPLYPIQGSQSQWGSSWSVQVNNQLTTNIYGAPLFALPVGTKSEQEVEAANINRGTYDEADFFDMTGSPPPEYTALNSSLYEPQPQRSPQNVSVRGIICPPDEDVSAWCEALGNSEIELEQVAENDHEEVNKEQEHKNEEHATPYSTPHTSPGTPEQQVAEEEQAHFDQVSSDTFLQRCEEKWQNKAKPAIAAMLTDKKHNNATFKDRFDYVVQCLHDLTEINSIDWAEGLADFGPKLLPSLPATPSKKRTRDSDEKEDPQSHDGSSEGSNKRRRLGNNNNDDMSSMICMATSEKKTATKTTSAPVERRQERREESQEPKDTIKYLQNLVSEEPEDYMNLLRRMRLLPNGHWSLRIC